MIDMATAKGNTPPKATRRSGDEQNATGQEKVTPTTVDGVQATPKETPSVSANHDFSADTPDNKDPIITPEFTDGVARADGSALPPDYEDNEEAPDAIPAPRDPHKTPVTPFGMALPESDYDNKLDSETMGMEGEDRAKARERREAAYQNVDPQDRNLVTGLLAERRGYVQRTKAEPDNDGLKDRLSGVDEELSRLGYSGDKD